MSSPPSPPRFHPPIPASVLLSQLKRTQTDPSTTLKLPRLSTGIQDIDSHLLLGGFQRGCIFGLSSGYGGGGSGRGGVGEGRGDAEGDAGRLIALHVLARTLLERPGVGASVIDATGSFPLVVLAGVVRWWAVRGVGAVARGEGVEERVNSVLERVGITRVFDIEGLWEVLGEVGGESGRPGRDGAEGAGAKGVEVVGKGGTDGDSGGEEGGPGREEVSGEVLDSAGEREIMDSEDDDEDDDLAATQRPPNPPPQPPTKESISNTHNHRAPAPANPSKPAPTTEIILVDNLTTLITTLFSHTSPPAAHALLAQLSRTLTALTRSSSLTIFLLNTLVKKSLKATTTTTTGGNRERERRKQNSVFGGMTASPSWGGVFDGVVDLHLMCFALPRGRGDAEGVYGVDAGEEGADEDSGTAAGERGVRLRDRGGKGEVIRFANIVEVLKDECPQLERWEGVSGDERPGRAVNREQRWATFKVVGGVGLEDEEFGGEG